MIRLSEENRKKIDKTLRKKLMLIALDLDSKIPFTAHYTKDGYVMIRTPFGNFLGHRLIMESKLRRQLRENEVVHHINHQRLDNRHTNLVLMTKRDHDKLTAFTSSLSEDDSR